MGSSTSESEMMGAPLFLPPGFKEEFHVDLLKLVLGGSREPIPPDVRRASAAP